MAGGIETFVIHLARATGRRGQVDALLAGTPYPSRILGAVDGSAMSAKDLNAMLADKPLFAPKYPFAMGPGELGCFLSHRVAWQAIVDENLDGALILEDDVALVEGFDAAVAVAAENLEELGFIQFQVRPVPDGDVWAENDGVSIVSPAVTPLRTSGQMVSRKAAQKLLELTTKIDRPVDTFLQMHWETGLKLGCVVPSGIADRTQETGGSTISRKRSLGEKVRREFLRSSYRRKVKRLSQ